MDGHLPAHTPNMGQTSEIPTSDVCKPNSLTGLTSVPVGSPEPVTPFPLKGWVTKGSGDQIDSSSVGSPEPVTPFPLKGWVTEGSGDQTDPSSVGSSEPVTPVPLKGRVIEGSEGRTIPQVREVEVRSNGVSTTGYSLVVLLKVKGKDLDGVVDTGADGTVINSKFIDITQFEAEQVLLRGLEPDRLITGHLIKDVAINLGGRMYRWDLYVAPIADDFLLGLDFMIAYKVDPLISRNVLMVGGIKVPATLKRGSSGQQQGIG